MRISKWNKELVIKTIKDLHKQLGRRPVKIDNHALYHASRKHFGRWNNAMKTAGYEVLERQNPILPQKFTPELSYFLGLLITDGHLQFNENLRRYKLSLFTSYEEELKVIYLLIKLLFQCEPRTYIRKSQGFSRRDNYDIYINSKDLIYHLNEEYKIPIGAKSFITRIPNFIFNTSKENIGAFIRGVIDGDGSVKKWSVDIASGSYKFLEDIKKILNKFNIKSRKIRKERTCLILSISSRENLDKLYSLIYDKTNFYYPRKKEKFKKDNI